MKKIVVAVNRIGGHNGKYAKADVKVRIGEKEMGFPSTRQILQEAIEIDNPHFTGLKVDYEHGEYIVCVHYEESCVRYTASEKDIRIIADPTWTRKEFDEYFNKIIDFIWEIEEDARDMTRVREQFEMEYTLDNKKGGLK